MKRRGSSGVVVSRASKRHANDRGYNERSIASSAANRVLDFGAQAGANAIGLGPYYRAGKMAYNVGKALYKTYGSPRRKGNPVPAVVRGKMGRYHTRSYYVGRFKRKRIGRSKTDVYLRNGFKNTAEVTGVVADPDCVYVGHSTTCGHRILTIFLQAALRKLFKKSVNWTCTNVTDHIRGYQGFSDGYRLVLQYIDTQTGTVGAEEIYDTTTADTIYRIVGDTASGVAPAWPNLYNFWINYIMSAGNNVAGSTQKPLRLMLYAKEANVSTFWQFRGDIHFPDETINLFIQSDLKIQNRTLATDGSADAEDVSNAPLQGRSYEFSSAAPRPRIDGVSFLEGVVDSTGAITVQAAQFAGTVAAQQMKEPPEPRVFWNVVKKGKVLLNPGAIRKDTLTYKVSMNCYRFFEKLDWRPNVPVGTGKQMKAAGKCALFALEDMINVNLSQNISIAYEINRVEMCYLSTSRTPVAQGMFVQQVQNSIPV